MNNFVEFIDIRGTKIMVNKNYVTVVSTKGRYTYLTCLKDDPIILSMALDEVMAKLDGGAPHDS